MGVTTPLLDAEVELEVPFHDVDVTQVVWHGFYVKYLEIARSALLRKLDYDFPQMCASGYAWPVVQLYLKYVRPARYGQRLRVRAELLEVHFRLKVGYLITDADTGERLTKGYTVQVAVDATTQELQLVAPAIVRDRFEHASAGVIARSGCVRKEI